jgi:hypothetical protein
MKFSSLFSLKNIILLGISLFFLYLLISNVLAKNYEGMETETSEKEEGDDEEKEGMDTGDLDDDEEREGMDTGDLGDDEEREGMEDEIAEEGEKEGMEEDDEY